ncbi:MAG TPA: DUF6152 family protein [Steroidobacteraceae bacterium]|nr:DUF6152 family protein [Steroidobacteraceae bacterium]
MKSLTPASARRRACSTGCSLALLLSAAAAHGHHSNAIYDSKQTLTVQGIVTKYEWANPHVYIYIEQRTAAGQKVEWKIEGSPPSILRRLGWSSATLKAGDSLTVMGNPARDASDKTLFPMQIKRADTTLFDRKAEVSQLASAGAAPTAAAKSLEGTWVTLLDLKSVAALDDPDKLPLTAAGTAALKRFDEKTMHPGVNCVPFPAPVFMVTPDLKRITKADGVLLIDGEFDGAQRTVYMNVATHDGVPQSIQGHSIGRWEGKTLVIDTTQFAYHRMGNAYGLPSSSHKHLVERLTPNDQATSLTYHFELTDPEYLTKTVSGDVQWVFRPNVKYAPDKCNRENARRFLEQ